MRQRSPRTQADVPAVAASALPAASPDDGMPSPAVTVDVTPGAQAAAVEDDQQKTEPSPAAASAPYLPRRPRKRRQNRPRATLPGSGICAELVCNPIRNHRADTQVSAAIARRNRAYSRIARRSIPCQATTKHPARYRLRMPLRRKCRHLFHSLVHHQRARMRRPNPKFTRAAAHNP